MKINHLIIITILTFAIRGFMYISYPIPLQFDDNQSAQQYLIDEIRSGNLLVGNLRYNTGYAFVAAPFDALSDLAGDRLNDRVFLLIQIILSALIPYLVYDIMCHRFSANLALLTAILLIIDPFGLQWSHFILPPWWITFCFTSAFWLLDKAHRKRKYGLLYISLAAIFMGIAVLARLNIAPAVAILGSSILFWFHLELRKRLQFFILFGALSAGILLAYLLTIHYQSTGTLRPSCIGQQTRMKSVTYGGIPIVASNGKATQEYLQLLTYQADRELSFHADSYPLWRIPDTWVSEIEYEAFAAHQPPVVLPQETTIGHSSVLYYYLGPCETDDILGRVNDEAMLAYPLRYAMGFLRMVVNILIQNPHGIPVDNQYLPESNMLEFEPIRLGFSRATGVDNVLYTGQIVWQPGIRIYSTIFPLLNNIKYLSLAGLLWAIWRREWFITSLAFVLLGVTCIIAIFAQPEPRYYAVFYSAYPILIAFLIFDLSHWLHHKFLKS